MDDVPTVVWSGSFRLFGIDVRCHRLSDGRNIIEEDSMRRLLAAMSSGTLDIGDVESFARFRSGQDPSAKAEQPK
jgi:hypothetical protein